MKLMIASDLHGSAAYTRRLLELYRDTGCQRLVLLGDLLYHGPRNPLPEGYEPPAVAKLLNDMADELLCVRGNCDAEVDRWFSTSPFSPTPPCWCWTASPSTPPMATSTGRTRHRPCGREISCCADTSMCRYAGTAAVTPI